MRFKRFRLLLFGWGAYCPRHLCVLIWGVSPVASVVDYSLGKDSAFNLWSVIVFELRLSASSAAGSRLHLSILIRPLIVLRRELLTPLKAWCCEGAGDVS